MTVTAAARYAAEETLNRWFDIVGVDQLWVPDADRAEMGWTAYARCGQWHPAAPSPEIFFPTEADSPETYVAQQLCVQCPVRRLCADRGRDHKERGIWGGIRRDDAGNVSPLCTTAGCMRYRKVGHPECGQCIEAAERTAKRQARVNEERRAARRAIREAEAEPEPVKEVVAA